MTTRYIKLGAADIRQDVETDRVGFDVQLPAGADRDLYAGREAWEQIDGLTHYDAGTVACEADDADDVEEALRDAGYAPTNRRTVYAATGPQGDVIHAVYED